MCSLELGLAMLIWPKMAKGSIVTVLIDIVGWPAAAIVFVLIGLFSVVALIVNGRSLAIGPRVRSICAILRSVLWAQFTLSMLHVSFVQGFPSPMVVFFSVFTAAEFYVVYRAVLDVRDH